MCLMKVQMSRGSVVVLKTCQVVKEGSLGEKARENISGKTTGVAGAALSQWAF